MRSRLVLADDNPAVLNSVSEMLTPEFDIVGTTLDGGLLEQVVHSLDPDLIVLDITMPGLSGLELARRLQHQGVRARVVLLTVHDDSDYVHEAQSVGVSGYVTKSTMAVELPHAIREALAGRLFVSSCIVMEENG